MVEQRCSIAARDSRLANLRSRLAARDTRIAGLQTELAARDAQVAALQAQITESAQHVQALLTSTSWWFAAPLRLCPPSHLSDCLEKPLNFSGLRYLKPVYPI